MAGWQVSKPLNLEITPSKVRETDLSITLSLPLFSLIPFLPVPPTTTLNTRPFIELNMCEWSVVTDMFMYIGLSLCLQSDMDSVFRWIGSRVF